MLDDRTEGMGEGLFHLAVLLPFMVAGLSFR